MIKYAECMNEVFELAQNISTLRKKYDQYHDTDQKVQDTKISEKGYPRP